MPAPTVDNVERPRAFGFGCEITRRLFRLATGFGADVTIETAPSEAPRVDTASSPEEIVEDYGRVFARSAFDGGEGLFRAHVEGAAPNRYWDSMGVEVSPPAPGEFPEIRLAKQTERVWSTANLAVRSITDGSSVWVIDGDKLQRFDDPNAASPTPVQVDPFVGAPPSVDPVPIGSIALLGTTIYASCSSSGIRRDDGSGWSDWNSLEVCRLWSVKGRIVASDGQSLYEVLSSGAAPSALLTLPEGREWTGVADAGEVILASATDGYVYAFTTADGTMALVGQTLFDAEQPVAVGAARGRALVGTQQGDIGRLWTGVVGGQGGLTDLQLLREWRGAGRLPLGFAADRTSLYAPVPDGTGAIDVWRFEFLTLGLSRHRRIAASGSARSLFVLDSKLWVTVDEDGLWRDSDLYVDEGWLIGPLGDFFSASEKAWVGARLETAPLNDELVSLMYATVPDALSDSTSALWTTCISRSTGSSSEEVPLVNVSSRSLAGMVRLKAGPENATSPRVRSFAFRAFSSSGAGDVLVTLPVNISDQIERRGRSRSRVKGLGATTYEALRELEGRPALLKLYEPEDVIRGLVESVGVPVEHPSGRRSVTTVALVRVRGRRTSEQSAVAVGTLGAVTFGSSTLGGQGG